MRMPHADVKATMPTIAQPTVYVVQDIRKNLVSAQHFGQLVCLLDEDEEVSPLSYQRIVRKLRRGLQSFTDNDYLLCAGNPTAIGMAAMIASDLTGGLVNFLKWDNQAMLYSAIPVDIDVDE